MCCSHDVTGPEGVTFYSCEKSRCLRDSCPRPRGYLFVNANEDGNSYLRLRYTHYFHLPRSETRCSTIIAYVQCGSASLQLVQPLRGWTIGRWAAKAKDLEYTRCSSTIRPTTHRPSRAARRALSLPLHQLTLKRQTACLHPR